MFRKGAKRYQLATSKLSKLSKLPEARMRTSKYRDYEEGVKDKNPHGNWLALLILFTQNDEIVSLKLGIGHFFDMKCRI